MGAELGVHLNIKVGAVVFAIDKTECIRRMKLRESEESEERSGEQHGTEYSVEEIVECMIQHYVLPSKSEGLAFCRYVRNDADFERVMNEVDG